MTKLNGDREQWRVNSEDEVKTFSSAVRHRFTPFVNGYYFNFFFFSSLSLLLLFVFFSRCFPRPPDNGRTCRFTLTENIIIERFAAGEIRAFRLGNNNAIPDGRRIRVFLYRGKLSYFHNYCVCIRNVCRQSSDPAFVT